MTSEATPVTTPAMSLVHGSQAQPKIPSEVSSGRSLPPGGNPAAEPGASAAGSGKGSGAKDVQRQVALLNKFLNDSGKADQFRVSPDPHSSLIQEINPANGEVIGSYPAIAFPALARSLGLSSALIDEHA